MPSQPFSPSKQNKKFDHGSYLARINLPSPPPLNAHGLKQLHNAQHQSIPFENFDIALGHTIELSPDALINKLITKNRGGYCFEVNGLLLIALQHFGFNARALLGRVHLSGVTTGRGHQITLVTMAEQSWIVDVGFGSQTPRDPIPLIFNKTFSTDQQKFRLINDDKFSIMLQIQQNQQWNNLYSFELNHVCAGDIDYGNHFTSTHPQSTFYSSRIASLATAQGGITLHNHTLRIKTENEIQQRELSDGDEYLTALKEYFGIDLHCSYAQLKPLP